MAKKMLIALIVVMLVITNAYAQPNTLWTQTFGGGSDDVGYSVQQTSDGGYIIAGQTESYGAGALDVYLIKTDASGNEQWTQTFGGGSDDVGYSVQQTSDGGYIITGYTYSYGAGATDVYLIKTDSSGNEQWSQTYGGGNLDRGHSIDQTSDGGYIIAGMYSYSLQNQDVYLIKTDASGNEQWSQTFGGSWFDWGESVQQTNDGGYIIAGSFYSYGALSFDVYLIKTNVWGNEQWSQTLGGIWDDVGYSVQQTSDGGYIIAGFTDSYGAGATDVYLIKTDASGSQQWSQTIGGSSYDVGRGVQQTSDGGYVIAGRTESYGAGGYDVWLIRLAPETAPDFTVTLTYNSGSPVPAGGGAINFDVFLQNNETFTINFDLWIEIPPAIVPPFVPNRNLTFPGGFSITRPDMDWPIGASWPAGNYDMVWNIGDMSTWTAWASDSFPFEKSADDDGSGFTLWEIEGDPLDQLFEGTEFGETVVSEFALLGAYPNPFNPSTTISYLLPEASKVTLTVYDINGRQVAELVNGWRDMGVHEAVFDASNLASGIYLYRLTADNFTASGKMVLMK